MKDLNLLAADVGKLAKQAGYKIATVESCTGGWLGKALTEIVGSSEWYEAGFITYSNTSKVQLVQVDEAVIQQSGAVSEPVAIAMANGALNNTQADVAVATTGIAGPDGGTSEKPVGTVWFAWIIRDKRSKTDHQVFSGNRTEVREQSVVRALSGLISLF
mgnify:CR=1 FL=1|tara:strand:+ start:2077 stop:2556 length:480 start_codon:yes stop_codon:yes gene_type:complete